MTPLTRESEVAPSNASAPTIAKPQPVAVEIPITVNGARTVAGSDKREPFSETTQTVLVFGSGAVIRLAAAVGPGQLLFVTNEKSKREVVCQVVKSKQNGSAGGYVELKFTEPAADFWGVRIPGVATTQSGATASVTEISGAPLPTKSLEQKLSELQNVPAPVPTPKVTAEPARSVEIKPIAAVAETTMPVPALSGNSGSETKEPKTAQVIPMPVQPSAPPITSVPKVPTLSEFLTHGENGVEMNHGKPKAGKTDPASDSPFPKTETPVPPRASLPSSLPENAPTLSTALQITQNPAPGSLSFDLAAEEVKIPSWLEPLARNSASPSGNATEEGIGIELPGLEGQNASVSAGQEQSEHSEDGGVLTIASEGRAPNFGSSLALGSESGETPSSGKGWKIVAVIIVLLLGAAAVWYWYVNQPAKVSASSNRDAAEGLESVPAPVSNADNSVHESPGRSNVAPGAAKAAQPIPTELSSPASASAKSPATNGVKVARSEASPEIHVEEPAKKPALGEVHLAAPVVSHNSAAQENGAADPGLAINGVAGATPNSLSLLSSNPKEPAAPVTVGGEVKPAKLLSSVPPVYPQIARKQRVSGDVTIDASIDASGRVSATRVISGPSLLHQAAIDAVKQWKYQAATLNGQATAMHLTVTVQFRLQ